MRIEGATKAMAIGLSMTRVGLGLAMAVAPRPIASMWIGRDGRRTGAEVLSRATGARDAALGMGAAAALMRRRDGRAWVAAQMAADTGDLATTLLAGDRIPKNSRRGIVAMASAAIAASAAFLLTNRSTDQEPAEQA